MKRYLTQVVEWAAHRILARAVQRAAVILDEMDASYETRDYEKSLPSPVLPAIEHG